MMDYVSYAKESVFYSFEAFVDKKSTKTEYGQTFLLITKQIQISSGMVAQEVECQVLGELLLWVLKQ